MPALTIPYAPQPGDAEDVTQLNANFQAIKDVVNALDDANIAPVGLSADSLAAAVVQALGLSDSGSVRRGKSIIATEEARTNVAYGLLTTPDRVQSIVLPTDGLIVVTFRALVKNSVASAGRVALFVGANQLKLNAPSGVPFVDEPAVGANVDDYEWVYTDGFNGLTIISSGGTEGQASSVTTGMAWTSTVIEAAAGTYDISVQFKASSGSITAKERKLWVEARGF